MNDLGAGFDALLVRGAVGALGVASLWCASVVVAVAVEARTDGRLRSPRTGRLPGRPAGVAPRALRRLVRRPRTRPGRRTAGESR